MCWKSVQLLDILPYYIILNIIKFECNLSYHQMKHKRTKKLLQSQKKLPLDKSKRYWKPIKRINLKFSLDNNKSFVITREIEKDKRRVIKPTTMSTAMIAWLRYRGMQNQDVPAISTVGLSFTTALSGDRIQHKLSSLLHQTKRKRRRQPANLDLANETVCSQE